MTILFKNKNVVSLPGRLDPHTVYFVRPNNGQLTAHITDSLSKVMYVTNDISSVEQIISTLQNSKILKNNNGDNKIVSGGWPLINICNELYTINTRLDTLTLDVNELTATVGFETAADPVLLFENAII